MYMSSQAFYCIGALLHVVTYTCDNARHEQVDILISKNQALQMLCLKHHVYKTS